MPARPSRLLGNLKRDKAIRVPFLLGALPTNSDRRPFRDAEGVLGASTSRIRQMVCTAEFGAGRASRADHLLLAIAGMALRAGDG